MTQPLEPQAELPPYGSAAHVFEVVREDGEIEMLRPVKSLWWSGVAAGMTMSMSVLARAAMEQHLPDAVWAPLIASFGYCAGFLIVILSRMQLFTENTITTVLPLLRRRDRASLMLTTRLWAVVFTANMAGALAVAFLIVHGGLSHPEALESIIDVSRHGTGGTMSENFRFGIPAGFMIAALVWMMSAAASHRFALIIVTTYLIALAEYTHVVAGAVEVFVLAWSFGGEGLLRVWTFIVPALFGNVVGGTGLFALLAYAQVVGELPPAEALHEPVERSEKPDHEE